MMIKFKKLCTVALCTSALAFAQDADSFDSPEAAAAPVEEVAAPAPAPEPEPEPVAKAPEPEVTQSTAFTTDPKPSSGPSLKVGARIGVGLSAFRDHKAQTASSFGVSKGIQLDPALSFGAGVALSIGLSDLISIAPELQYTYYRANGSFSVKSQSRDIPSLNEAGVGLHAIELPILLRFDLGGIYTEVGPQLGLNVYSTIYRNHEILKPELNAFAFGPSLGGGIEKDGLLIGVRGYFGLIEYAENTKGYPWTVQASVTKFFF